jgi:hypothetical protein
MSHIGTEKDWKGLLEFYLSSPDYVPTLKLVTIAQWILESRKNGSDEPGTNELAVEAINFAGLRFNPRMEAYGAEKYEFEGENYCKFEDVEHFIDGYFYFITSGGYDRWHQLADRPLDFIAHLEEKGFAGSNAHYTEKVREIYENLKTRYKIDAPEAKAQRHVVTHGDFTYKIADEHHVEPDRVFKLDRSGAISYGSTIGVLHTGDLLYVLTGQETAGTIPVGTGTAASGTASAADPLGKLKACDRADGSCAGRTHFVIHQTVAGNLTRTSVLHRYGGLRNKAHVYILKSGEAVFLWSFEEKLIRATKAEFPGNPKYKPKKGHFPDFSIAGKLIHCEVDYEENGEPNSAQYDTLARLYIEACQTVQRILTIVPHIEIDRGIKNGHNDPQNFDYNHFYSVLTARGVDITRIPKFEHDRYWDKKNYKTPFDTDTFHFPPVLSGNPHA